MSKERATIGADGLPLPILPPELDARVCGRLVRVMFYLPGFMALLLIKAGEPASFGITVELLMLSSAAAIIGGMYIGSHSSEAGAEAASKAGVWSGMLVLELLAVVPFLCALPSLFYELAHSDLLHAKNLAAVNIALGGSELLPLVAILPFMLYELAGFGMLSFAVPKIWNWVLNLVILGLILGSYIANREGQYSWERKMSVVLVILMVITVFYGVLKLKRSQATYDAHVPAKPAKEPK